MAAPPKIKSRTAISSNNFTSEYVPKRIERRGSKRYLYIHVHSSIIHSSQRWKQTEYLLTDQWVKKIWYIRTVEYYSALNRKEILTHATTWMNLEVSEISQIQKDSVSCHLY